MFEVGNEGGDTTNDYDVNNADCGEAEKDQQGGQKEDAVDPNNHDDINDDDNIDIAVARDASNILNHDALLDINKSMLHCNPSVTPCAVD